MSTDVRGFAYALEPLRRRQRWQLEALQAKLGVANREIAEATRELMRCKERLREQHANASEAMTHRVDPALHRRSLHWLAQLRKEIGESQAQLDRLRERRSQLLAECLAKQNKLDVIERHRGECLTEYAQAHQSRLASAADGDWLARYKRVAAPGGMA